jgi:serine/threonine-protein kinase
MMHRLKCPKGHQWDQQTIGSSATAVTHMNCPTCGAAPVARSVVQASSSGTLPGSFPAGEVPVVNAPTVAGYEILSQLGRGGMGVVYKARQTALKRLVALKMVLSGEHAGAHELARFKAEGEAVARLQHPNIVQIYDVGQQQGRPYFSLEYVEGGSLAGKLSGTPQPPRVAAGLIETLARAMQYAHERGIVHRDLKPANILLKADGTPKITDFGLAKQMKGESDLTKTGAIVGTPSYLAPEQAAGKGQQVGPAADVYALGAIMYEMLTGGPPFRGETPLDTVLQVLAQEPVPPTRLQPKVPRDLETICLKCLQKDPRKRYVSAALLADDLQHFQKGEPIKARPIGPAARFVRWCLRNPLVAALTASLFMILLLGLTLVTWQWLRAEMNLAEAKRLRTVAEENLNEAKRQKARAEENSKQARQAVDFFFTKVSENQLLNAPNMQRLRKELLDEALKYYQNFLKQHKDDPQIKAELGSAYHRVGLINIQIGSKAEAANAFEQALTIYRELVRDNPKDAELQAAMAQLCNNLGAMRQETGRHAEALPLLQESLALREKLANQHPQSDLYQRELGQGYHNVAVQYYLIGRTAEAQRAYEQAGVIRGKLVQTNPSIAPYLHDLASTYYSLGVLQHETGQAQPALRAFQQARDIRERLVRAYPAIAEYQLQLGTCCHAVGEAHRLSGNYAEALKAYQQAKALREKLAADNPSVTRYQRDLAQSHYSIGATQQPLGQSAEALRSMQQARDIMAQLVRTDPSDSRNQRDLGRMISSLGQTQRLSGHAAEGVATLHQACELLDKLVRANPDFPDSRHELGRAWGEKGKALEQLGRREEALTAYRQAIEHERVAYAKAPQVVSYAQALSIMYTDLGRVFRDLNKPGDAAAAALERRKSFPTNAGELYQAACDSALAAALVGKDKPKLSGPEEAERRRYADQAMDALRSAVTQGYKDVEKLKATPDLAMLRDRADFIALVSALEKKTRS